MRMRRRMGLFATVFLVGGLGVAGFAVERQATWVLLAWFAVFASLQFFVFRCPHCRRLAIFTTRRAATPFVGTHCRHCGKGY